jgi:nucleoside transporter
MVLFHDSPVMGGRSGLGHSFEKRQSVAGKVSAVPPFLKVRLSIMMFLQYVAPGALIPILTLYLTAHLQFTSYQSGVVMSMPALAAIIAPFLASHIADRWLSAERMLVWCHLVAGLLMLLLARVESYSLFVALYFLYGLAFTPSFGLTNAVALHRVQDANRDFGAIRLWGTVGWLAIAWLFGFFWMSGAAGQARLPHAVYFSSGSSFLLAAFTFIFLPPAGDDKAIFRIRYREVARIFIRPEMLLLCLLALLTSACHQFYYYGMSPFLHQMGLSDHLIMPAMSVGQASEAVVLGVMGWCLLHLRIKTAMILGVVAQGLRLLLFAFFPHLAPVLAGIGLHGICYAFFFTTAYLYVERHSTTATRAGAQQLLTIMISGVGVLAGSWGAGWTAQYFSDATRGQVDFRMFWLVPALMCVFICMMLAAGFHERPASVGKGEDGVSPQGSE